MKNISLPVRLRGTKNRCQRQRGFNLIELMIALTIGLMLVAGLGMILFSVRGSYLTQDGLARMQEGERFFLTSLNNSVQTASYFIDPVNDSVLNALPARPNNLDGSSFAAGQGVVGTTGTASDTVNTRYQSAINDDPMNCLGLPNISGAPVVWISSYAVNAARQLVCTVTTIGPVTTTTSNTEVLVANVAKMKVLYGVGANGDGQTRRYMDSTQVSAADAWQDVVSVKVTITQEDLVNGKTGPANLLPLVHVINLMNQGSRRSKAAT